MPCITLTRTQLSLVICGLALQNLVYYELVYDQHKRRATYCIADEIGAQQTVGIQIIHQRPRRLVVVDPEQVLLVG